MLSLVWTSIHPMFLSLMESHNSAKRMETGRELVDGFLAWSTKLRVMMRASEVARIANIRLLAKRKRNNRECGNAYCYWELESGRTGNLPGSYARSFA
jgi:hypothetical protein